MMEMTIYYAHDHWFQIFAMIYITATVCIGTYWWLRADKIKKQHRSEANTPPVVMLPPQQDQQQDAPAPPEQIFPTVWKKGDSVWTAKESKSVYHCYEDCSYFTQNTNNPQPQRVHYCARCAGRDRA